MEIGITQERYDQLLKYESDWLSSTDPAAMLRYLRFSALAADVPDHPGSKWMDRKLRLWCLECCRLNGVDERELRRLENEGMGLSGGDAAWAHSWATERTWDVGMELKTDLLRHIFGNPWRPSWSVKCERCLGGVKDYRLGKCPVCHGHGCILSNRPLIPAVVEQLALVLYEGDQDAAGLIHDELEMSDDVRLREMAEHFADTTWLCCCGKQRDGSHDHNSCGPPIEEPIAHPHGCWVLDALLNKE